MLPSMTADPPGRADLHAHTDRSDGSDSPRAVAAFAAALGLDVLAVTDHDTLEGALRAADHTAALGGPEVVIGEEVTSRDGHIIGLFLERPVEPGRSARDTVAAIHDQGGVAIAAHPLWHTAERRGRPPHGVGKAALREVRFDAVEVRNGGVTPSMAAANREARAAVRELGLIGVGGSDAHVREALGCSTTLFSGRSAQELRDCLAAGEVEVTGRCPDPALLWHYLSWVSRKRPRPRVGAQIPSLGRS
jgi:predicted metal-dependent phosphoesterase TrpH